MLILPSLELGARSAQHIGVSSPVHGWISLHLFGLRGVLAPSLLAGGLFVALMATVLARRVSHRRSRSWPALAPVEPWGSGRRTQTVRMQYTSTSFAEPLQRVFDDVIRPARDLNVSPAAESHYYVERIAYRTSSDDVIERVIYQPLIVAVRRWGRLARKLQNGSVHRYLAYGLLALVIVLVVLA
jgi:hypothetical protein